MLVTTTGAAAVAGTVGSTIVVSGAIAGIGGIAIAVGTLGAVAGAATLATVAGLGITAIVRTPAAADIGRGLTFEITFDNPTFIASIEQVAVNVALPARSLGALTQPAP